MKKQLRIRIAVPIMILFIVTMVFNNTYYKPIAVYADSTMEKRAVWISYLDYSELKDKNIDEFRANFSNMCNSIALDGMNTIIVQVRAFADSIYPSAYYPWSKYITSSSTGPGYDPLRVMIEIAHQNGLKFEAWFNPYRVSTTTAKTVEVKQSGWVNGKEDMLTEYLSGDEACLILNPASQRAIDLITVGVKEVLYNYDVDGIHFDDYFYKREAYPESTKEERIANVDRLVSNIYATIKSYNPNVIFGISPNGDIAGCINNGADVTKWMTTKGYVDYIMPQIYWSNNYGNDGSIQKFSTVLNEWKSYYNGSTKLYVGLALYKCGQNVSGDIGWSTRSDNLYEQLTELKLNNVSGFALFRYAHLHDDSSKAEFNNVETFLNDYNHISDTLFYQVYTTGSGWTKQITNGNTATLGENSKKIEALRLAVDNPTVSGDVEYSVYMNNTRWTEWYKNYAIAGENDNSRRIEAVKIRLTGELSNKYDVIYRTYVRNIGWTEWTSNGEPSGSTEMAKSIDAIQAKLVNKNEIAIPKNTASVLNAVNIINMKAHVQNYGWKKDTYLCGDNVGTVGESRRLETVKINKVNTTLAGSIKYRVHVQNIGWMDWKKDGEEAGTTGKSLRIEAMQIQLTSELSDKYDVYYRVHVQNKGWLGWAKNGEIAGTTGMSLRVEAVQFICLEKGAKPPVNIAAPSILTSN